MSRTDLVEITFSSQGLSLKELHSQIFSKKQELEALGFSCPWLLEDIGESIPLLMASAHIEERPQEEGSSGGTFFSFCISKTYDEHFVFAVFIEYDVDQKVAYCSGSLGFPSYEKTKEVFERGIKDFYDVTGLKLNI